MRAGIQPSPQENTLCSFSPLERGFNIPCAIGLWHLTDLKASGTIKPHKFRHGQFSGPHFVGSWSASYIATLWMIRVASSAGVLEAAGLECLVSDLSRWLLDGRGRTACNVSSANMRMHRTPNSVTNVRHHLPPGVPPVDVSMPPMPSSVINAAHRSWRPNRHVASPHLVNKG
jgi:hypothetical protein